MSDAGAGGGRPVWACRIRAERLARGWSQAQAVEALRVHAPSALPSSNSLLRNWKRWEAGDARPDDFYQGVLAKAFGTVTAALFPRLRSPEADAAMTSATGMDTLDLVARLRASDVTAGTIEALQVAVTQLGVDYSHIPADHLLVEGRQWLSRLTALLDRRLTLAQHREVLRLAGRVAVLVGCVEYDLHRTGQAEATRRAALSLGREAAAAGVVGWAHEMRSWYELTRGQYARAIAAAQAGLDAVGPTESVAVQLCAHQARAWARIGDRRQVEIALDNGRATLEALAYRGHADDHLVVDPPKFDFYTMDVYRHLHEDTLAEDYARVVIRSSTGADGSVRKPMRVAEAHMTLGVVAARAGDVEAAVAHGRQAWTGGRRSLPSLTLHTREFAAVLTARFPGDAAVSRYLDEIRSFPREA